MARKRWRIAGLVGLVGALVAVAFVLAPAPIDPAAYRPAAPPSMSAENSALEAAELIAPGRLLGPEDVAVDAAGRIYAGLEDGRIVRLDSGERRISPVDPGERRIVPVDPGERRIETLADTGGRPLGLDFDREGNLIVCDAVKGLLSMSPGGELTALATEAEGLRFGFTNDVDVASDGTIYFSDASSRFGHDAYLFDLLEARPHGRLLAYHPERGEVEVLLRDLYFANGVALSRSEDFVVVNETYRYRALRYWLSGPRAGSSEIFVDNLPGFPDGISSNGRGTFWMALFTVRNPTLDGLHPHPRAKALLSKLPRFLWPKPKPFGLVMRLNERGDTLAMLEDPTGRHLKEITSAQEADGALYLGTLHGDRIGRYELGVEAALPTSLR